MLFYDFVVQFDNGCAEQLIKAKLEDVRFCFAKLDAEFHAGDASCLMLRHKAEHTPTGALKQ
jgi:hypothetical protein